MTSELSMPPVSPPCNREQELVSAARDGDDRAFEALYSGYHERIASFIRSRVRDHGRAEDIGQEVFISALRRLRASQQPISFKPWIYEIAKNACIDEFRRRQRNQEVSLDADQELTSGRRGLLSVAPTPPAAVESKQRLDDLQGAFGGLSENHRQLLMMREFEGLSYDEIASRTEMSRQMVESTLFRARRKLTEEYDELASGRRCEQVQDVIQSGRAAAMRSFGIRERRQLSRHLAHCQPCRREALLAGVDQSLVKPRRIAAKTAALLPLPIWRWPWRGRGAGKAPIAHAGSRHLASPVLQSVTTAAGPTGSSVTLGQAAAAVAALTIAGAGGGFVTSLWEAKHPIHRPVPAHSVHHAGGSGGSPAPSVSGSAVQNPVQTSGAGAAARSRGRAGTSTRDLTRTSHARAVGPIHSGPSRSGASGPGSPGAGSPATNRPSPPPLPPTVPGVGTKTTGTVTGGGKPPPITPPPNSPLVGGPPVGGPPVGLPPVGLPPVGLPPVGLPPVGVPPVGVPPISPPPVGVPPVGVPPISPPPVGGPPVGLPPISPPPISPPPVGGPPVGVPPVGVPPVGVPPVGVPPVGPPPISPPSVGVPPVGVPPISPPPVGGPPIGGPPITG